MYAVYTVILMMYTVYTLILTMYRRLRRITRGKLQRVKISSPTTKVLSCVRLLMSKILDRRRYRLGEERYTVANPLFDSVCFSWLCVLTAYGGVTTFVSSKACLSKNYHLQLSVRIENRTKFQILNNFETNQNYTLLS